MAFELPSLPYSLDALGPAVSGETLEFHHGKHHAGYVSNLNKLTEGTELAEMSLEDVIRATVEGPILNNAAQAWNHGFYWQCMTPERDARPSEELERRVVGAFGGIDALKEAFVDAAVSNFGSGWTWLVVSADGELRVVNSSNANTPLVDGADPLLVCDVWEHAYCIDYRNARPAYLEAWWEIVNWEFVSERLARAT